MDKLRIAAFQRHPQFGDIPRVLERLQRDLAWCDGEGVDLALFPECYLQGYVVDRASIGAVGLGREGRQFQSVLDRLAPHRSTFILGPIERLGESMFNSASDLLSDQQHASARCGGSMAAQEHRQFAAPRRGNWLLGHVVRRRRHACGDAQLRLHLHR